jgi:UDP-N-acetylmuramate dehydrogenase
MIDIRKYSVLKHNTFGIDVKTERYVEYSSVEELVDFICAETRNECLPLMHIGGGSNLLFTSDFNGTLLHSAITGIECIRTESPDVVYVRVGAG